MNEVLQVAGIRVLMTGAHPLESSNAITSAHALEEENKSLLKSPATYNFYLLTAQNKKKHFPNNGNISLWRRVKT